MTKYTPGPWKLKVMAPTKAYGYGGKALPMRYSVEHTISYGRMGDVAHIAGLHNEEMKANAQLIAAAPELLECLLATTIWSQHLYLNNPKLAGLAESVERAVAVLATLKRDCL